MLSWFQALLPKEDNFFRLFDAHAATLIKGAEAMRRMLDGGEETEHWRQAVIAHEHEADDVAREVLFAVRRSFITPFDRSDIRGLTNSLDDAIDQMQKTAKSVMLFNIRSFAPQMKEMGDAIVKCAVLMEEAIPLLHSISTEAGRISWLTEQIGQLEGRADDLHDIGL